MYNFDASIPLEDLIGQEVTQVCFGLHDIIVRLGDALSISIFVKSTFYADNNWDDDTGNSNMLGLLGGKVAEISIEKADCARMAMDDGAIIRFFDSPSNLESFAFSLSGGQYVI